MKKIYLYSGGCTRRSIDCKKTSIYFLKNGYTTTNNPKEADYIIFFTCGYINSIIGRNLKFIKKLQKYKAELIVAGCLPDIAPKQLEKIFTGKIITTKNIEKIDEIFKNNPIKFRDISDVNSPWINYNPIGISYEPIGSFKKLLKKYKLLNKLYSRIKVQMLGKFLFFEEILQNTIIDKCFFILISRGCNHKCSYCSIKNAVGSIKSKPISECIKEFKQGLEMNYKYFILDGDNSSQYGLDLKIGFIDLLDELTKIEGDYLIKLNELDPNWIIKNADRFETILKRKKIKYLLFSIQSANNRILKLMKRPYEIEGFKDILSRMKKSYPDLNLGGEFITGFPTETKEEFQETLKLIKEISFDNGWINSFSNVPGTEVNSIEPKISRKDKKKRMKIAIKFLKNMNYIASYRHTLRSITFNRQKLV